MKHRHYLFCVVITGTLALVGCSGGGRGGMDPNFGAYPETAFTIHSDGELIGGPVAQGRIGDVLLQNDKIRVIIQKPTKNTGVNSFGGNIIDADIMGGAGDHFGSLFPLVNMEWTVNYYNYEVASDGTDGGPKVLRALGRIDVYDYLNLSFIADVAQGLVGQSITWNRRFDDRGDPFDIYADLKAVDPEVVTEYRLDPGANYVRIDTTYKNTGDTEVKMPVGEFINGSGALQMLIPGLGFAPALMSQVAGDTPGIIYAGMLGTKVSYGYFYDTTSFKNPATGERLKTGSLSFSGVTGVLLGEEFMKILAGGAGSDPAVNFIVPAQGSRTITRYLIVGDGSAQSVYETALKIFGVPTRTVSGVVKDATGQIVQGATVALKKKSGGTIVTYTTDDAGSFLGKLPYATDIVSAMMGSGVYDIAVNKPGHHLNGTATAGSCDPSQADLTSREGVTVTCTLGDKGTVQLAGGVADADTGVTMPARLTIVGEDPSPEGTNTGTFRDINVYRFPFGVIDIMYLALDGTIGFTGATTIDLEPGTYLFVFSHGMEYTAQTKEVTVTAGGTVTVDGVALKRVVPTPGYISIDFHHHSIVSPDSWVPQQNRVLSAAAEGMDVLCSSEHDYLNDYGPYIRAVESAGYILPNQLKPLIGDEITPNHYGHFNAYPFAVNLDDTSNGAMDWSFSPLDEVSTAPDYGMSPNDIVAAVKQDANRVVQINHIMDNPTGLLTATGWVTSALYAELGAPPLSSFGDPVERRIKFTSTDFAFPVPYGDSPLVSIQGVDTWEVMIGYDFAKKTFMESSLPTWFNLLNLGAIFTAVGDTDSHDECSVVPGLPRNYVASSVDPRDGIGASAAGITDAEIVDAVKRHKVIVAAGAFVTVEAKGADGVPKGVGDVVAGTEVTLTIRASAPSWAWFDTIDLFANTEPMPIDDTTDQPMTGTAADPEQFYKPYHMPRYTYQPVSRFRAAEGTLTSWKEENGLITAEVTTTIKVDEDTWVVVFVHGTKDSPNYRSLFPIVPTVLFDAKKTPDNFDPLNLSAFHKNANVGGMAWALANPIFIDADSDGKFTAKFVKSGISPLK